MESTFMTAVTAVGLPSHAQGGVSLLPVSGGFDGTRVSNANRIRVATTTTTTTKNAGAAGTPGYPSWSHPV